MRGVIIRGAPLLRRMAAAPAPCRARMKETWIRLCRSAGAAAP